MQLQDDAISNAPAAGPSRHWRVFLRLVLILVVIYFTWRGPIRGMNACGDLTVGYAAGRAWIAGEDPYRPEVLLVQLSRGGAGRYATAEHVGFMRNIYLPTALPLYVPLALFPWEVARALWVGLNIVAVLGSIAGVLALAGVRLSSAAGLVCAVLVLALAPVHTALALGQSVPVAAGCLVAGAVLEARGRSRWAGLLYGLAIIVKVQIGLPFVIYVLWRRRWGTGGLALLLAVGVTLLSVGRMQMAGVPWYTSLQGNLQHTFTAGGYNDAIGSSPGRYTLINLAYLLHVFTDSRLVVGVLTYVLVGIAGLAAVARIRGAGRGRELLGLSLAATLGLLVTYHRTYDAILVIFPLGWALSAIAGSQSASVRRAETRAAYLVAALCASFVLPVQVLGQHLEQQAMVSPLVASSLLWRAGVLCLHVWAIALCVGVLLWAAWRGESHLDGS